MSKRRRNSNLDAIIYIFVVILAIGIVGNIIDYVVPITITCGIVGAIIGVTAIIKNSKTTNSTSANKRHDKEGREETESQAEYNPKENKEYAGRYEARSLLTNHEMHFYTELKPIADKLGLSIISKVRMADLVKPTANYYRERSEYMSYFGKIKAKHVDFVLCDPNTLKVRLLIELDDRSHEAGSVMERDEFVEYVYQDTGYKLLRTYTSWDLEKKIRKALNIEEIVAEEAPQKAPVEDAPPKEIPIEEEPTAEELTEEIPLQKEKPAEITAGIPLNTKIIVGIIALIVISAIGASIIALTK